MPKLQLYDKLLQFPMFQGMSRADLMQLVTYTRLDFVKYPAGKRVLKEEERCDRLVFLVNGTIKLDTRAADNSYTVSEEIPAPYAVRPECIFGISQRFGCTVHALTDTNFITIGKKEVVNMLESFIVFRLNMLNIFAAQAQRLMQARWQAAPQNLEERISRFFTARCLHQSGRKTVSIYMERLASEVNDSRLDVSRALNRMQAKGLLHLGRGRIIIPSLERLATV